MDTSEDVTIGSVTCAGERFGEGEALGPLSGPGLDSRFMVPQFFSRFNKTLKIKLELLMLLLYYLYVVYCV